MNKETLEKAKRIENRILTINWELSQINKEQDLTLCGQYASGTHKTILTLDNDIREFIKVRLNMEKEQLEKELEEL